jgi:hypothetical protein
METVVARIEDPRDSLEKARRAELERFAKANGVKEINGDMPAILMRAILRQKGLTRISIPPRTLGQYQPNPGEMPSAPAVAQGGGSVDAVADLARQFAQQQAQPEAKEMSFTEIRSELKRRGIKFGRSDKFADLKAKLNV